MHAILAGIAALLQLVSLSIPHTLPEKLRSGELLRFHVVAQDDTAEMQRIKLCVRDAVHACYVEKQSGSGLMLLEAARLLPALAESAESAARQEGFDGEVRIHLGVRFFSERMLGSCVIPAGEYPALMVYMGDAQGQNWWGLLDPVLSLELSQIPDEDESEGVEWDWSFWGLIRALLGISAGKGA